MREFTYTDAILQLRPGSCFTIFKNNYATLNWLDESTEKPTEQEIQDKVAELRADYNSKEYQRKRVDVYPSFAEQFDLLYHGGYDAWKQTIQAVKDKYPKE